MFALAIAMKLSPSHAAPASPLEAVLARMDPAVATSFTSAQCQALNTALTPRRHRVNVRLSLPLGWTRLYLVLLLGTEQRSRDRRRLEATQHPLWTPTNLLAIGGSLGLGVLLLLGLVGLSRADLDRLGHPAAAPAAVPFKADRASCEASGRSWQEDTCLDFGHDPTF